MKQQKPEPTVDPEYIRMPEDDDPAGEGHMFTPGPDWPPARPNDPKDEGDTPAEPRRTCESDDPECVKGAQNDADETSKPFDEP